MQKRHLCHLFKDTMSVSLDQNFLHLSFKPYTSNKSYSHKYVKQTNVLIHAFQNLTEKCGQQTVHVCCLHLKMEFRSCARGVSGVASFITTDEQLQ